MPWCYPIAAVWTLARTGSQPRSHDEAPKNRPFLRSTRLRIRRALRSLMQPTRFARPCVRPVPSRTNPRLSGLLAARRRCGRGVGRARARRGCLARRPRGEHERSVPPSCSSSCAIRATTSSVPAPSYPLFEHLGSLRGGSRRCRTRSTTTAHGTWTLRESRASITPRTRAIVVVSPNNPTGSYLKRNSRAIIRSSGCRIISDEVFASYSLARRPDGEPRRRSTPKALSVFALDGLSEARAFSPQMKLAWITVGGSTPLGRRSPDRTRAPLRHLPFARRARSARSRRAPRTHSRIAGRHSTPHLDEPRRHSLGSRPEAPSRLSPRRRVGTPSRAFPP